MSEQVPGSAAPVWLVLDSRGQVVSVAGSVAFLLIVSAAPRSATYTGSWSIDLRRHNKSLSVQIIVGAMEGAAAIVRAVAHDRLCELANATD